VWDAGKVTNTEHHNPETQKKKKKQRGVMLGNAQYLPHLPPLPVVSNNSNHQQQ
jgi:hypothetical protein